MEMKWFYISSMFMFLSIIIAMGIEKQQELITERVRIQYDCTKKLINQ